MTYFKVYESGQVPKAQKPDAPAKSGCRAGALPGSAAEARLVAAEQRFGFLLQVLSGASIIASS